MSPKTRASNDPRADFFRVELALSSTFADMAELNCRIGHSESAESSFRHARKGCATLHRFLSNPNHAKHLTEAEKQETIQGWEQLRDRLAKLKRIMRKKTYRALPAQNPDAHAH